MKFEEILSKLNHHPSLSSVDSQSTLNNGNDASMNVEQNRHVDRTNPSPSQIPSWWKAWTSVASTKDESRQAALLQHPMQRPTMLPEQLQAYQYYPFVPHVSQNGYANTSMPWPPHPTFLSYQASISNLSYLQRAQANFASQTTEAPRQINNLINANSNLINSVATSSQATAQPINSYRNESKSKNKITSSKQDHLASVVQQNSDTNVNQLSNQLIDLNVENDRTDLTQADRPSSLLNGDLECQSSVIACGAQASMGKRGDAVKNKKSINKPVKESAGGDQVTRRGTNLFNKPLKPDKDVDDVTLSAMLGAFKQDLLHTSQAINDIVRKYNYKTCCVLFAVILEYFEHLKERLATPGISYIDLINHRQYSYDDFCSFGSRFFDFIHESTFFSLEQTTEFTWINHQYGSLFPKDVMEFRQLLINLKFSLSENISTPQTCPVDHTMITYPQVNHKHLFKDVASKNKFSDQMKCFLNAYEMPLETSQNQERFVILLNNILRGKFNEQYVPVLHTFGSFSNGLGTYNSDLDIFIEFKGITSDVLDFGTSLMALEVILEIMKQDLMMNANSDSCIIQSRRCPIIKLAFHKCFHKVQVPKEIKNHIQYGKCDISLNQIYGVYNSKILHLLTKYDRRFYEMTMVLKFWAKCNGLIGSQTFSTYAFTMLIIYFLQQQQPPVLPTFEKLYEVAPKKIQIHKWVFPIIDDTKLLPPSKSRKDTLTLIREFFTFYSQFKCYFYAIRPRTGQCQSKFSLAIEKEANRLVHFNPSSYFCIEDPFVLDHNVGFNFRQKFVPKFYDMFLTMASLTRTNACMRKLTCNEQLLVKVHRSMLMLPINFFRFEWEWNDSSISVRPLKTEAIDIDKLCSGFQFYFWLVLRRFFQRYLNIADHQWGLNYLENRTQIAVNYRYLEAITKSLAFDTLLKFLHSKANTSLPVLKRFRQQLSREKRDVWQMLNLPSPDCREPWFEMDVCKTSYGFAFFNVQPMMPPSVPFYKKADLILEAIFILLQHILITVDRANPQESFEAQMQLYLSD